MNREELKRFIEYQGYTFLSVVEWKKSFRVRYETKTFRCAHHFKIPLAQIPPQNDGSKLWFDFCESIPKVRVGGE